MFSIENQKIDNLLFISFPCSRPNYVCFLQQYYGVPIHLKLSTSILLTSESFKSLNLSIIHGAGLVLAVCVLFSTSYAIAYAQTVDIPDPALRTALEMALGKQVDEDITQEDMASLESFDAFESGIRNIRGLEFAVNLTQLHLGLNHISNLSSLKGLKKLTVLDLHRNGNISNVTPLKDLTNLTWLSLRGNRIVDMSPLKGLINLTYLHVAYNRMSDVSPFKSLTNLTFLDIEVNRVSDLSPLSELTNLTYLDFDSTRVSDLSPIKTLTELKELDASDNQISDISTLKYLTKLTYLDLDDNQISDISVLSTLTKLMILDLDDNQILDVSPLKGLTRLTWLDIDHSRISDVTPLKNLINLKYLDLNDNIVVDVTPLKNLINLTELDLDSNKIHDISPLSGMTKLTVLDLHGNQISDVTPLKNMINLKELDLDDNEIVDVTPLSGLTRLTVLDLDGNRIIDVTPLKNLTDLTVLDLHDNHIEDFSPIEGLIGNLMDYDASGQTEPPSDLRVEPPENLADVNRDGVVNLTDLVMIASNFHDPDLEALAESNIFPDVNKDGSVDIIDLLIAASEIVAFSNAPTFIKDSVETTDITTETLSQWIWLARQHGMDDPQMLRGIAFLEQLLEVLAFAKVLPRKTALLTNYPNPFNPETWIPYQLAKPAEVNIYIYTADGKLVRTLQIGHIPVGVYRSKSRAAYWDGRNNFGEAVASGIYLYTFTADDFSATGKMLLRK